MDENNSRPVRGWKCVDRCKLIDTSHESPARHRVELQFHKKWPKFSAKCHLPRWPSSKQNQHDHKCSLSDHLGSVCGANIVFATISHEQKPPNDSNRADAAALEQSPQNDHTPALPAGVQRPKLRYSAIQQAQDKRDQSGTNQHYNPNSVKSNDTFL